MAAPRNLESITFDGCAMNGGAGQQFSGCLVNGNISTLVEIEFISGANAAYYGLYGNSSLASITWDMPDTNAEALEIFSNPALTSLDFTGWTNVSLYQLYGNGLTSVTFEPSAAAGTALSGSYAGYYGGIDISNNNLGTAALDAAFTSLPAVTGLPDIDVSGNPGAGTCDTAIATGKGCNVITL